MSKRYSFIIATLIFCYCFSAEALECYVYGKDVSYAGDVLKVNNEGAPVTGCVRDYYDDKKIRLKWEQEYKEGRHHGHGKLYFPNGALRAEYQFENDREIGIERRYHQNGFLTGEINYDASIYTSYIYWVQDNKIIKKKVLKTMKDGKNPILEIYDENGSLIMKKKPTESDFTEEKNIAKNNTTLQSDENSLTIIY